MQRERGNINLSYDYLIKRVKSFGDDKLRMLDVGTNIGSLPHLMYKAGYNMEGVDIRSEAIAYGKEQHPEIADRLFSYEGDMSFLETNTYDVITMFDVIEHIPDPEVFIRNEIFRLLKPGGMFVFQTPNARINPIFESLQYKSFTKWKQWHCSLQTPKSLMKILERAGFEKVTVEKYTIDSEYNRNKLKKYFGKASGLLISVFDRVPLGIYPNLWGTAIKPQVL